MDFLNLSGQKMYRISIVGAGNVAFRMALFLQGAGHSIECVCARDLEKGEKIVRALKRTRSEAFVTSDFSQIPECDMVVIAVSDNAIGQVAKQLPNKDQFTVHTSGATNSDVLENSGLTNYGVLYPLMTLSMHKDMDIRLVPFLLEANSSSGMNILTGVVSSLKAEFKICDSAKRLQFHTAAIFATNIINYSLSLAYDIASPDFTFLLPSAIESVRKAFLHNPIVSQTGPARRGDTNTIEKHRQVLSQDKYSEHLEVYNFLTEKIFKKYNPDSNEQL